ncbi:MAG: response regulator, partial [Kangiellaceae bacterium]|nr:response regulator [Kangiellaceae bacterium]
SGKKWHGELWNKRKDSSHYLEDQTITPVTDNSGVVTHYISIKRDITEKAAMRQQLEQQKKMEAIGRIAGGVSHNFNNKLASILGYTELAMMKAESTEDESLVRYLSLIEKAGNESKVLVSQLQSFSKTSENSSGTTSVVTSINEIIELIHTLIPKSVSFNTQFNDDLPLVKSDPDKIQQMLMILIENSVNAIGKIGQISLSVTEELIEHSVCSSCGNSITGHYVAMTVSDNGRGIEESLLSKIFLPFYSSKDNESNGLNLSILHGLAHKNGSHLLVDSTNGGTNVKILFPTETAEQSEMSPPKQSLNDSVTDDFKVLVVDDDETYAELIGDLLTSFSIEVDIENDAHEAMIKVMSGNHKFDLLIVDQEMPGYKGVDFIFEVKKKWPNLPCILISGYDSKALDQTIARSDWISGFLAKPFKATDLQRIMDKYLK